MTFQTQGTVTDVQSTPTSHPQYGQQNAFRITLDNGITVSLFGKKASPNGKDHAGNWVPITVGARISCMYIQSPDGQYNNTKAGQITVLAQGNGQAAPNQPAAAPSPQQARGAQPSGSAPIDPKFAIGRWVNVAAHLVHAGEADDLQDGIRKAARSEVWATSHFDRILKEAKESLQGQGTQSAAPQPAPPPPPPAPSPEYPDLDDDIPF